MNTSNKNIERAHRVGEKSNDKEGAIVGYLRELKFPYSKIFPKR